jgi:flagellar biosynthesis/type III secretory pathway chaperone
MKKSLAVLVEVLNEKNGKLLHLKTLLEEEQEYISRFRAVELEDVNLRKEQLIEELKIARKNVRAALSECCREYSLAGDAGLPALIGKLPMPEKEDLSILRDGLVSLSGKIEKLLAANRGLLQSGLSIINRSMGFFRSVFSKSDTYGSSGRMMEAPATRLICKEI